MSDRALQRILGVGDGLAIVVGAVIGVGILRTPGLIAGYLGNAPSIIMTWLVGGLVALLASLSFAELAAMYPEAGGKFSYAHEAFGPQAGFLTGWAEIIITRGFSAASKAIVIGEYLIQLTGWGQIRLWATMVVLSFLAVNVMGLRTGRAFQNAVTAVKVGLILVIIGAGFAGSAPAPTPDSQIAQSGKPLLGFALAYLAVSFTYYGWDDFLKLAGEVRDPGRTLPRVLIFGAVSVTTLYLLINMAFLHALTPSQAAGSSLVAADAVATVFGGTGRRLITIAALVILVSSLNVQFMGLPRVAYGLAQRGLAPRAFAHISATGTPVMGLLLVAALILAMAMTRSFELLIQYLAFVAISVDAVVLFGLFRLRKTRPYADRPFRTPWYPFLPAVTIALYVGLFVIITVTQPALALGGSGLLAILAGTAWAWTRGPTARNS